MMLNGEYFCFLIHCISSLSGHNDNLSVHAFVLAFQLLHYLVSSFTSFRVYLNTMFLTYVFMNSLIKSLLICNIISPNILSITFSFDYLIMSSLQRIVEPVLYLVCQLYPNCPNWIWFLSR